MNLTNRKKICTPMKSDRLAKFAGNFMDTIASCIKVAIQSRPCSIPLKKIEGNRSLVIMGNGPSLRATIDRDFDYLMEHDLMVVNFAANAPDFFRLRPHYYMLADGHFFNGANRDPNVRKLWENLNNVSWEIAIFIPRRYRHFVAPLLMNAGKNISVGYFNLTPIEGFKKINRLFFDAAMGMPRPRNVMIPAIMTGIRLGYKKIYLCGADHTWTKTLDVDSENYVVTIQPHFYEDNEAEKKRVRETYKGIHLHDVLGSMSIAFRSYWEIADYAQSKGVSIINATPQSMIDAFPRGDI